MRSPSQAPIALLVTVYNRQALLERMLDSVRPEKHLLDIVIVDDGSDSPVSISGFDDLSIHLIRSDTNNGPMYASNSGLHYILDKGYTFIARLDSDDRVIGPRFTRQLAFLQEHPDIGIVGTHFYITDTQGTILRTSIRPNDDATIRKIMHVDCILHHSTLMIRADVFKKCGLYDPSYKAAGDYEFLMRAMGEYKLANLPDIMLAYETGHEQSISIQRRRRQAWNALKVRMGYFAPNSVYSYLGLLYACCDLCGAMPYIQKAKHVCAKLLRW